MIMKVKKKIVDDSPRRANEFINSTVDEKIKDFSKLQMKPGYIKVSGDGVFYTLQGEGASMGKPACFLRLHICNLRCSWCDAWYTWNPNTPEFWTESQNWTINQTKKTILSAWGCKNPKVEKRLVITGGEPLLQKDSLDKLIDTMPGWKFEIETNGTIMPTEKMLELFQFNCSPKLTNSGNPKQARIKADVLKRLNQANTSFKFVVTKAEDLDEIESDFVKAFNLDINKIIIMPQGVTAEEVRHTAQEIVEKVKEKGYRLLGRLQCEIWGAKRKV